MTDELGAAILERLDRIERSLRRRGRPELEALPLRQAARAIGIHPDTLRAHIEDGRVAAARIGRQRKVSRQEIDRVLREGLPALPSPAPASATKSATSKRKKSPATRAPAAPKAGGSLAERIRAIPVRR